MKKIKLGLFVVLGAVLLFAVFSGCSKDTGGNQTDETRSVSQTVSSSVETSQAVLRPVKQKQKSNIFILQRRAVLLTSKTDLQHLLILKSVSDAVRQACIVKPEQALLKIHITTAFSAITVRTGRLLK